MGYVQFLDITPEGVEWKDISELPVGDEIEMLLALQAGDYEVVSAPESIMKKLSEEK